MILNAKLIYKFSSSSAGDQVLSCAYTHRGKVAELPLETGDVSQRLQLPVIIVQVGHAGPRPHIGRGIAVLLQVGHDESWRRGADESPGWPAAGGEEVPTFPGSRYSMISLRRRPSV
jgi:hypothetical protein